MDGGVRSLRDAATARFGSPAAWLAVVLAGALALHLPFFRVVVWLGDEGILPHGAERILRGDRLYTDFFEFLPPGGYLLTAGWFQLFGISFGAVRSLQLALFLGTCALTYLACLRVSGRPAASATAVLLWAVMALNVTWELSHHWFTSVFCVGVLLALLHWVEAPERRLWLVVLAGVLGGAAAMVTPTRGALALLAGLLAFSDPRREWPALIAYCAAALVLPAVVVGYIAGLGNLDDAIQSVVVFPATRYAAVQALPYGSSASAHNVALALVFPSAALLLLLRASFGTRCVDHPARLHLCVAFAVAAFVGILTRPDIFYIARAVPFALPLLLLIVPFGALLQRRSGRLVLATGVGLIAAIPVWAAVLLSVQLRDHPAVESSRGVFVEAPVQGHDRADRTAGIMARLAAIGSGEPVFVYPYAPLLLFLAGRVQAAQLTVIMPSYTTRQQYAVTCRQVMSQAYWLVIDRMWDTRHWMRAYPAMPDAEPAERMAFEAALNALFAPDGEYGSFALLRRRAEPDSGACDDLARPRPL